MGEEILEEGDIKLRQATETDLELIMAWRSHPEVNKHFLIQDGPLLWDEHYRFWQSRKDRIDFMIMYNDGTRFRLVGTVNVSNLSSNPEIGILIGEITLMRKGIGKKALALVLEWLSMKGYEKAFAKISKFNEPSIRLFKALGFEPLENKGEESEWIYQRILYS